MGRALFTMGHNGLRSVFYALAMLLTIVELILTGILVNISKRHNNLYARGPMSWTLFMSCFTFLALIPLYLISQIRAFRRKRSSGSAVLRNTNWIEPALLFLITFLWVTAAISIATQSSFMNCGLSRCHTARTAVALSIILIPLLAFLTALSLLDNYRHRFLLASNNTAPHMTTGAGFQGPGATAGGHMGTTAFDTTGAHQPQYNDKMAGGPPEPGMMSPAPATGAVGNPIISSPMAQPNPVGGGGGYNPNTNIGSAGAPIVEGTQVQPAMPEARV